MSGNLLNLVWLFGFQNKFYEGEVNGISQGSNSDKLSLDPITGTGMDGFFLIPKGATIDYFLMFVSTMESTM